MTQWSTRHQDDIASCGLMYLAVWWHCIDSGLLQVHDGVISVFESDECIVHFGGIYFWVVYLFVVVFVSIGHDLQRLIPVASQL